MTTPANADSPLARGYTTGKGTGPGMKLQDKVLQMLKTAVKDDIRDLKIMLDKNKTNDQRESAFSAIDGRHANLTGGAKALPKDSNRLKKLVKVIDAHKKLAAKAKDNHGMTSVAKLDAAKKEVSDFKTQISDLDKLLAKK
jgi:hypothetical protein